MALVPLVEPPSLQALLLPVFLADRHLLAAKDALDELYHVQDFLEELPLPRTLQQISIAIDRLQRAIVALELYRIERMAAFQHALNVHHQRFGLAPLVDLNW